MPQIGLVLGAGGSVGHAFHAGVLAALSDATGWDARDADVIVGTSAGSVVGALLRAGLSGPDLAARCRRHADDAGGPAAVRTGRGGAGRRRTRCRTARRAAPRSCRRWRRPARSCAGRLQPWNVRPGALGRGRAARGSRPHRARRAGFAPAVLGVARSIRCGSTRLRSTAAGGSRSARDTDVHTDVATAVAASCAIPTFFEPVTHRRRALRRRWGALADQRRSSRRTRARPRDRELADVDRAQPTAARARSARAPARALRARAEKSRASAAPARR